MKDDIADIVKSKLTEEMGGLGHGILQLSLNTIRLGQHQAVHGGNRYRACRPFCMEERDVSDPKKAPKETIPNVRPLADRVVVRPLEETEDKKGGLYIPATAKDKPQRGEVVALGPGGMEKGERVPMELEVGQKVIYGRYSGTEVTIDDQKLLIIKESDVLAIVG